MNPIPINSQSDVAEPGISLPRHIAIVMDGNGRWAKRRNLPRIAGHRAGVEAARKLIQACGEKAVEVLTLFVFSSENWRRPQGEVGMLMELFMTALQTEIGALHRHDVRLRVIGAREALAPKLQKQIIEAEQLTAANTGLKLVIAANYGGRWDIVQAAQRLAEQVQHGQLDATQVNEAALAAQLALRDLPEPDLFIRTGGEQRISNFLLWQLAYTELYFTDLLWPDFNLDALNEALTSFGKRQRRFGCTDDQINPLTEQVQGA